MFRILTSESVSEKDKGQIVLIIEKPYAFLKKQLREVFGGQTGTKIIVNRRNGERRQIKEVFSPERRQADRRALSELSEGEFTAINLRNGAVTIKTLFDEDLADLSEAINDTYIPLGEKGRQRRKNLVEQDENAKKRSPDAVASRSQLKTTRLYCAGWDLVDALNAGRLSLYDLETEELPDNLREMSFEELEIYVDEMRKKRDDLQEQISKIADMRHQYMDAKIKSMGINYSMAFDTSVRRVILEKASQKGFRLPKR